MDRDIPEADWRLFRELREVALDRFCKRVLDEVENLRQDAGQSHHQRYLALYRLLQSRDSEIAHAFNDPRRSRMVAQLAAIHSHGLLRPDELARFSERTREVVEFLVRRPL
jgi:hypothetical protein